MLGAVGGPEPVGVILYGNAIEADTDALEEIAARLERSRRLPPTRAARKIRAAIYHARKTGQWT